MSVVSFIGHVPYYDAPHWVAIASAPLVPILFWLAFRSQKNDLWKNRVAYVLAGLLFLNEIETDMIPNQGTSLSSAINTAITAFTEEMDKFKVVLLVTDGEDHEGQAIDIAKEAALNGMIINI